MGRSAGLPEADRRIDPAPATTKFFDRPGHHLLGGTWNSRTYTSIAEVYIPYPPVPTPTTRGSWCLYWNFDQFLFVDPADETRGWGPFGRAGIADPDTSPINAFLSCGVGGNVPGRMRREDTFGVGWAGYVSADSAAMSGNRCPSRLSRQASENPT